MIVGLPENFLLDTTGLPTYHVTDTVIEPAGDGNMRIWNCARQGGILVPKCEIIISATNALVNGRRVADAAQEIFNAEMLYTRAGH